MNNYEIIKDLKALENFINWLPEIEEHECFYLALFSRKKYAPEGSMSHINRDKEQLKRIIIRSKDKFIDKIKQMEVAFGSYKTKDGNPISQKSLALYITPNPRSQTVAAKNMIIDLAGKIGEKYNGYNIQQLAISHIHKSKSKTVYVDFDYDKKSIYDILPFLKGIINKDALSILKTKNGCHVLVKINKVNNEYRKSFYNDLKKIDGCDIVGDNMIPVPGCVQGDFIPELIIGEDIGEVW